MSARVYYAIVDDRGILCVDRIEDADTIDMGQQAENYPTSIYFEVEDLPTVEDVKTALRENIEKVISEVATSLIALGASREWTMEHNFTTTEGIAGLADRCGLPTAGNQSDDDLAYWRSLADRLGIYHDGEDE